MRLRAALALSVTLLAGCGGEAKPRVTPRQSSPAATPSDSASPTPTPTAVTPSYGPAFFTDDFKTRAKKWPERDTESATYTVHTDYATPVYTMTAKTATLTLSASASTFPVTDDLEVRALIQTTLSVSHDDRFGVTCRAKEGRRYTFEAGYDTLGTGTMPWRITRRDQDGSKVLAEGEVKSGGSAFEIGGTCAGPYLVMTVNDAVVGQAQDADPLPPGYGGLFLYSKAGKTTVNVLRFTARTAAVP